MKTLKIGRKTYEYTHVEVRGVLAGAYRGRAVENRALRTHLVVMQGDNEVRTGCRLDTEHLVDTYGGEPEGAVPSCPTCARVWDRLEMDGE